MTLQAASKATERNRNAGPAIRSVACMQLTRGRVLRFHNGHGFGARPTRSPGSRNGGRAYVRQHPDAYVVDYLDDDYDHHHVRGADARQELTSVDRPAPDLGCGERVSPSEFVVRGFCFRSRACLCRCQSSPSPPGTPSQRG